MNLRKMTALLIASALAFSTAACGASTKKDAPEPKPSDVKNGTNTQVIQMPDGYRNVSFTCYGHNGVYVTSRGAYQNGAGQYDSGLPSSIFVVPNDEHCK